MLTRTLMAAGVIAITLAGGSSAGQSSQETLRTLDTGWARAYVAHDTGFALRLFHEHLVVTSGAGQLKNRDGELADIRHTPGLKVHDFRTVDVRIQVYDSTGVVTGRAEWSFTTGGRKSDARRRYTATYARGGPLGWQMVALHLSSVPPSSDDGA